MSSDIFKFNSGIDAWFKQINTMADETYRQLIWDIFLRLVRETPQYSGMAVANWNLSIGSPNMDFNPEYGDKELSGANAFPASPRQKGDRRWEMVAWSRNRPIKNAIKHTDKVFICNGVQGDMEWGDGHTTFAYLQAIQTPGKWQDRLREENKPYETVQESIFIVTSKYMRKGLGLSGVGGNASGVE